VTSNGARVLVVDDDESFRSSLTTLLAGAGYATLAAESGERALVLAEAEQPALVVLDLRLPDLSGLEICRRLRERFGDDLPIVFVSGERTEALDRVAGLSVGGDDYLVKPFDPEEFLARLRRLLRHRPLAPVSGSRFSSLSARERQVLKLMCEGYDQAEIADQLSVARGTVGSHVQRVLAKLGVHNRVQAVALVLRDGGAFVEESC
jgi:two-component system nitrate/nitrite response regulator NarL